MFLTEVRVDDSDFEEEFEKDAEKSRVSTGVFIGLAVSVILLIGVALVCHEGFGSNSKQRSPDFSQGNRFLRMGRTRQLEVPTTKHEAKSIPTSKLTWLPTYVPKKTSTNSNTPKPTSEPTKQIASTTYQERIAVRPDIDLCSGCCSLPPCWANHFTQCSKCVRT